MRACHLGSTELRCAGETQCRHERGGANSARALTEACNGLRRSSMGGRRVARSVTPRVWQRGDERLAAGSRAAGADVIDACLQSERFRAQPASFFSPRRNAWLEVVGTRLRANESSNKSLRNPGMK